jgi:rhodanese-related sulfurtransferase
MTISQPQTSIGPAELQRLAQVCTVDILDVRTPAEFATAHLPGAQSAPLDTLDPAAFLKTRDDQSKPIYIVCQAALRARKAIEKFQRAGFVNCVLVEGGTQAWLEAGLPVIRGSGGTLSLLRQVQITIGIISGTGAALALTVHQGFALLPLFTGCGLLFAGLTGTCGLALLLAKMPWNQATDSHSPSCCEGKV